MSFRGKAQACILLFSSLFLIMSCNCIVVAIQKDTVSFKRKKNLTESEKKNWHFKDVFEDSIPGINLHMAYDFLKDKKGDTVIVAVIDTELDIAQEDLKNQIWINKDEIPNNNIDDDNNGYIDDIHGWNYVGTKKGDKVPYSHFEYVRIIKKYDALFKNITSTIDVPINKKEEFNLYQKAYSEYNEKLKTVSGDIERFDVAINRYIEGVNVVKLYLPNIKKPYDKTRLDSLKKMLKNEEEIEKLQHLIIYKKYNHTLSSIRNRRRLLSEIIEYKLNFDFDERYLTNDNTDDLNDFPYGNNDVQGIRKFSHSTKMSSIIAAERNDTLVEGINDKVKIMPLSISVAGNEHDKDIALAIRYAVDNGAKVINMSIGKDFSLHPEWVYDAIKYAEKHNVLIVTSAGNDGYNLDKIENYPNDNKNDGIEFVKNFMKVGNTSYRLNLKLINSFSNYGKEEVDIFAPGTRISCLSRKRTTTDSGTSFSSAVATGVASLLFSYYPCLSPAEVKQIIMESGTSFNIMVNKPSTSKEKELVPFSSLSKSGKIVNAYNALLMAEEVSKKKKKKKRS
ncbi:S8 family serine peptidase [Kordia sp. YSTF-M3]|uniref:S8 family serine peptidase n=1 Tax=Kordia aestuariivivens TaxID=2759037 RepID=A0ABR7Q9M3_9FLAO|nr:S8 family serine peptidase [Kordia aestuariivivens]MBC8755255.1 S8 family serine peptidase [Kordia aestuariivivens]